MERDFQRRLAIIGLFVNNVQRHLRGDVFVERVSILVRQRMPVRDFAVVWLHERPVADLAVRLSAKAVLLDGERWWWW